MTVRNKISHRNEQKRWRRLTVNASLQSWESWKHKETGQEEVLILDQHNNTQTIPFFNYTNKHPRHWEFQIIAKNKLPNGDEEHCSLEFIAPGFKFEDLEEAYLELKNELKHDNPDAFDIGWIARIIA